MKRVISIHFSVMIGVVLILLLMSCGMQNVKAVSFTELSPKQKATYMMGIYNSQYEDYNLQASFTDLTETEKEVLRAKKKVLTKVWPLIRAYDTLVVSGSKGTPEQEQEIMALLSQLQRSIIRKIQ